MFAVNIIVGASKIIFASTMEEQNVVPRISFHSRRRFSDLFRPVAISEDDEFSDLENEKHMDNPYSPLQGKNSLQEPSYVENDQPMESLLQEKDSLQEPSYVENDQLMVSSLQEKKGLPDSPDIETDQPRLSPLKENNCLLEPPDIENDQPMESPQENEEHKVEMENEQNLDSPEEPALETIPLRRSTRKKIRTSFSLPTTGISNKPVKLTVRSNENEVKKYYLDKKVKLSNLSLETIFEEPQVINNEQVIMSSRKFRRSLNFDSANSAKNSAKIRKRKTKAKKIKTKKMTKVTLKHLMEKLNELE